MITDARDPIFIDREKDYLISTERHDMMEYYHELKGSMVIDFLKNVEKDREISRIEVREIVPATGEEAREPGNATNLFCISYIQHGTIKGNKKNYRVMMGKYVKIALNGLKKKEEKGMFSDVTLRLLILLESHETRQFARDFYKKFLEKYPVD
jgi:hypothetical protein